MRLMKMTSGSCRVCGLILTVAIAAIWRTAVGEAKAVSRRLSESSTADAAPTPTNQSHLAAPSNMPRTFCDPGSKLSSTTTRRHA